jgi:hypothetical protein
MKQRPEEPPSLFARKYASLPRVWSHEQKLRVLRPRRRRREWAPDRDSNEWQN